MFNTQEEKKRKKRDPRSYQRQQDDRKALRQQERDHDLQDLEKEARELAEREKQKVVEALKLEEK